MLMVLVNKLAAPQVRAVKRNFKLIIGVGLQLARDIDSLRDKHVFRLENNFAVELHCRKGIQAIKSEDSLGALGHVGGRSKGGTVRPHGLADPLNLELIFPNEGVGDEFVVEEVEMHVCRELGDGEVLGGFFVDLLEVPPLGERNN